MIRVIVCDDHEVVRMGLVQLFSLAGDVEVVGEAGDYSGLRQALQRQRCEVLVIDIEMPGRNGIEALAILREENPGLRAVVLSAYPEREYAIRALRAGAAGYVNKAKAPSQLVDAVREVAKGRKYISPEMSEALARSLSGETQAAPHQRLSDRELQVLRLIAAGKRLSEIAQVLAISPKTVSVYRSHVLQKLQLANNIDIAQYALRQGLTDAGVN